MFSGSKHEADTHPRVLQDSAGNCDTLLLAPRQQQPPLAHMGVVLEWKLANKPAAIRRVQWQVVISLRTIARAAKGPGTLRP